jgi:hypothetical protein
VRLYHRATLVLSVVIALLGVALLVAPAARGGGSTGLVIGGLFVALGVARFTLERKRPRP